MQNVRREGVLWLKIEPEKSHVVHVQCGKGAVAEKQSVQESVTLEFVFIHRMMECFPCRNLMCWICQDSSGLDHSTCLVLAGGRSWWMTDCTCDVLVREFFFFTNLQKQICKGKDLKGMLESVMISSIWPEFVVGYGSVLAKISWFVT